MAHSNTPTSSARGSSRSALIIVGVLALMGLAYSIARVDILRARIVNLQMDVQRLQDGNGALRSRLDELNATHEKVGSQLAWLQTELGNLSSNFGELRDHAEQAQRQSTRSEALYLLRLANNQLRLTRDTSSATDTLAAAEVLLRNTGDATLDGIHQQVRTALTRLQTLPRSEITTIQQQLSLAEQQAGDLKLSGIEVAQLAGNDGGHLPGAGLERAWALLKRGLGGLLSIRKIGTEASAILSTDEQALRRRHLQLLLLNARLATYIHDQNGYVTALRAAGNWLDQAFDTTTAEVGALRAQLEQLAQHNIAPATPDLSPSIQALARHVPGADMP